MHCVSIAAKSEVISYVAEPKHCYRSTSTDCRHTPKVAIPHPYSFQFVKLAALYAREGRWTFSGGGGQSPATHDLQSLNHGYPRMDWQ
jgi:hypothetical protein